MIARRPPRSVAVEPTGSLVAATERSRRRTGRVAKRTLVAAPTRPRLGSRTVTTRAFNGRVPGPEIRLHAGDVLRATVVNRLTAPLTIHWHGIALRNDMDGVPDLTQKAIAPGASHTYTFTVPHSGTFFYHSHVGTQLDRGLYGPLIVDDAGVPSKQRDVTLMLDDWLDGTGTTPDAKLAALQRGTAGGDSTSGMNGMHDMSGMDGMSTSSDGMQAQMPSATSPLGADVADIQYPYYLIDGRPAGDPATFTVTPGEQIRIRLINAASTTPFRVAFAGGKLTVIAADGFPVKPVTTGTLLVAMGERYDVLVTVPRFGAFPLVARAEGTRHQALAVLRTGPGTDPMPDVNIAALDETPLRAAQLQATGADRLGLGKPDRSYTVTLTGSMSSYRWGISAPSRGGTTLPVRLGERVRLVIENKTMMWHPIHLHGHTFQLLDGSQPGARKDTVIVPPMSRVSVGFVADNPGRWMLHCHNAYHQAVGMSTTLSYVG